MMLKKLLNNKIMVIVLAILVCVSIVFLFVHPKTTEEVDIRIEAEQENGDEDEDTQADEKEIDIEEDKNDVPSLVISEPNGAITGDSSSDASGIWDETEQNDVKTDTKNDESEEGEDILKDDITWGEIY